MLNIRLRQLKAYQAIMNAGSVTSAAEVLNLTQSSVSRLLANFETELGIQLFYRQGRRLVPSVEGRQFFRRIEGALAAIDGISTIADDVRLNQGERLRLCAIGPLIFGRFLPKGVRRFAEEFPETKFTIDTRRRIEIEDFVASRQADLGFTLFPVDSVSVDAEPITTVAAVAILPPAHPLANKSHLTPEDLKDEPVILPNQVVRLRQMADAALLNSGIRFSFFAETSTAVASCQLVAQGLGIGISDPFSVTGLGKGALSAVRWSPELKMTYGAVWPKGRKPSARSLRLLEILKEVGEDVKREVPAAVPNS